MLSPASHVKQKLSHVRRLTAQEIKRVGAKMLGVRTRFHVHDSPVPERGVILSGLFVNRGEGKADALS